MAEPITGTSELRATPVIESFCDMIYKEAVPGHVVALLDLKYEAVRPLLKYSQAEVLCEFAQGASQRVRSPIKWGASSGPGHHHSLLKASWQGSGKRCPAGCSDRLFLSVVACPEVGGR